MPVAYLNVRLEMRRGFPVVMAVRIGDEVPQEDRDGVWVKLFSIERPTITEAEAQVRAELRARSINSPFYRCVSEMVRRAERFAAFRK